MAWQNTIPAFQAPHAPEPNPSLNDLRFRALLGKDEWDHLPAETRRRFSKRLADGKTAVYVGEIDAISFSLAGRCMVQLARLIGGPLPIADDVGVPMIVTVTEDIATGGQIWTRICARRDGFPQVIHSSKRFAGRTGLEEYVGFGISMALRMSVETEALIFHSSDYFFRLGVLKLRVPSLLTPGALTVTHSDLGHGLFRFTLEIIHPHFGPLVRQSAVFREVTP
ncbi:MAG TPA: DUF4166 domain-containing protein [Bradyrhizobium sp.]|nr:DUF4166 domain-containing protein [Bradyrhizobium sp.]